MFGKLRRAVIALALVGLRGRDRTQLYSRSSDFLRRIADRSSGDNNDNPRTNGEHLVLSGIRHRLKGGSGTVFDVGAFVGDWTAKLCEGMGRDLKVYCFEPSRDTFEVLIGNLDRMAPKTGTVPVNAALGETDGTAVLHIAARLGGVNSLFRREGTHFRFDETDEVRVVRGDTFCKDNGIEHIDFLKIDTEGAEMAVLTGFEHMLDRKAVGCIQFEYGGAWIDARRFLRDAFRLLQPRGYVLGKILPGGIRLSEKYYQRQDTFKYANFLAMRPDWRDAFPKV